MSSSVSVQVCTLNEAGNIGDCLEAIRANSPSEVVVVDGGSTDTTVAIARDFGARVIEAGRIGLARQRRLGYMSTDCEFTAFVDADDRLEATWLEVMVQEAQDGGYAALQSLLRVPEPHSFWTGGWDTYFRQTIQSTPDTVMVGRPALYLTSALKGIAREPGMIIEDTEMSRDFEQRGLRQGIGTAVSYRYCPEAAGENLSKWRGYGRGYRQFVTQHPERTPAILKHMLWTIPVHRSIGPVLEGRPSQAAFGLLMASSALLGFLAPAADSGNK